MSINSESDKLKNPSIMEGFLSKWNDLRCCHPEQSEGSLLWYCSILKEILRSSE